MQSSKIISIYSTIDRQAKGEYAINLAAALARLTATRAAVITFSRIGIDEVIRLKENPAEDNKVIKVGSDVDILIPYTIDRQYINCLRGDYRYVIMNLSPDENESIYEIFSYSDAIHLFVDSTKDDLIKAYNFLEGLSNQGMRGVLGILRIIINRLKIFDKFSEEEIIWLIRRDIWAIIPECGILDMPIDPQGTPLVLKNQEAEYSKAILRIAKKETGRLLGLALGSGAAFGLAHIGVLKVLERRCIPIDVLSGSSIGALIASMRGLGFTSERIENIAKKLRNKLYILRLLDFTIPASGILAGRRLKGFIRSILGEKRFEDLLIPVKIIVYDLTNREAVVIDRGRLADAVYMSVSVPGIFQPESKEGRLMIDGGVSNPVPVDVLLREGVNKIIAVNVLPGPDDIYKRNMLIKKRVEKENVLLRNSPFYVRLWVWAKNFFRKNFIPNIFDIIMTSMQSAEYILAENSCKHASLTLHPVYEDATSIDFHLVNEFIKRGEEEAAAHLEEIERLAFG